MSAPVAIVTRAEPGAAATAALLVERGWTPLIAPLLEVQTLRGWADGLDACAALALTSANGARALTDSMIDRMIPVFCVGDATADAARAAGFRHVFSADGDVTALATLIIEAADGDDGLVRHVSGAHVAGDLVGLLGDAGVEAERVIAYRAEGVTAWPAAWPPAAPAAILFHSPRAAEVFAGLRATLGSWDLEGTCAVGISATALAPVADLAWAADRFAEHPTDVALLAALGPPR